MQQLKQSPEKLQSEIEVKYLVNPESFPEDLAKALENGKNHPDILRKGRITQLYLPVTEENKKLALGIINKYSVYPLTDKEREHFANIENVIEIRILQREEFNDIANDDEDFDLTTKGKVRVPDSFQVTIKGKANDDGTSRPNIETPISLQLEICDTVVDLLEASVKTGWIEKDNKVEKMWYDIQIPHPNDSTRSAVAELDIFPDLSYLAIAEVEFSYDEDIETAKDNLPAWFQIDVTGNPDFKVRNLVGINDLENIQINDPEISAMIDDVRSKVIKLYQPTVLGENLKVIEKHTADKTFVVLGSFKRFIPQFRRIVQDLERRSAGVYPPISTLDVARRQGSRTTDHNNAAFRIQAEEDQSLISAEKGYLKKIKNSDAVLVIAPDERLGKSSGQELIFAISENKEAYLSGPITRVADDLAPSETRVLVSCLINYLFRDLSCSLQKMDITPIVLDHIRSIYRKEDGSFDEDAARNMVHNTLQNLLQGSVKEDAKRIALNEELTKREE